MVFAEYCPLFLAHQENVERNSAGEMAQKRMCLANHLVPFFGSLALGDITASHVTDYVRQKQAPGCDYAPTTINNHLALLGRLLRQARDERHLEQLPALRRVKDHRQQRANFLTQEQTLALLQAADRYRNPRWRLIMMIALGTGMRIGEILALDWASVDIERTRLQVRASMCRQTRAIKSTKSKKERTAFFGPMVVSAFTLLAELSGGERKGLILKCSYESAQRAMKACVERAGLPSDVSWHTLRHTFASNLIMAGESIYVVKELLGHSSITMTERYAHLDDRSRRAAVKSLDKLRFVGPAEAV